MNKIKCFLRKAWPCLCLLCGLVLTGCAVSKPAKSYRTYQLTVTVFPGTEPSTLPAECGEVIFSPTANIVSGPRHLTLRVRLPTEQQLQEFCARLTASGVIVERLSPAYY